MIFRLLSGDRFISEIDTKNIGVGTAVIALPILGGENEVSLISEKHLSAIAANLRVSVAEIVAAMGVTDAREAIEKVSI